MEISVRLTDVRHSYLMQRATGIIELLIAVAITMFVAVLFWRELNSWQPNEHQRPVCQIKDDAIVCKKEARPLAEPQS